MKMFELLENFKCARAEFLDTELTGGIMIMATQSPRADGGNVMIDTTLCRKDVIALLYFVLQGYDDDIVTLSGSPRVLN